MTDRKTDLLFVLSEKSNLHASIAGILFGSENRIGLYQTHAHVGCMPLDRISASTNSRMGGKCKVCCHRVSPFDLGILVTGLTNFEMIVFVIVQGANWRNHIRIITKPATSSSTLFAMSLFKVTSTSSHSLSLSVDSHSYPVQ